MRMGATPGPAAQTPQTPTFEFSFAGHTPGVSPQLQPQPPVRRTVTPVETAPPRRSSGKRAAGGPSASTSFQEAQPAAAAGDGSPGAFSVPFVFNPGAGSATPRSRAAQGAAGTAPTATGAFPSAVAEALAQAQPSGAAAPQPQPSFSAQKAAPEAPRAEASFAPGSPSPLADVSMASSSSQAGSSPSVAGGGLGTPTFSFGSPAGSAPFLTPQSVFPPSATPFGAGPAPSPPAELPSPQVLFGASMFSPGAGSAAPASAKAPGSRSRRKPAAPSRASPRSSPDSVGKAARDQAAASAAAANACPPGANPFRVLEEATARRARSHARSRVLPRGCVSSLSKLSSINNCQETQLTLSPSLSIRRLNLNALPALSAAASPQQMDPLARSKLGGAGGGSPAAAPRSASGASAGSTGQQHGQQQQQQPPPGSGASPPVSAYQLDELKEAANRAHRMGKYGARFGTLSF